MCDANGVWPYCCCFVTVVGRKVCGRIVVVLVTVIDRVSCIVALLGGVKAVVEQKKQSERFQPTHQNR